MAIFNTLLMQNIQFYFKNIILFGSMAIAFSLIGFLLEEKISPHDPLPSATIEHIIGHIIWGFLAALASKRIRYIVLCGIFAIVLDVDHLANFIGFDLVSRMGHSLTFAIISATVLIIANKRDYILGSVVIGAIFSHVSFDIFLKGSDAFPLFSPFNNEIIYLQNFDWAMLQIFSFLFIWVVTLKFTNMKKQNEYKKENKKENK